MGTEDDIAVVRANSAAFSDRDVDTMLSYYAPDAVVADQRRHGLGTFTGHDELRPYYLSIFHAVDAMREQLEVLAARDGVVVCHCELWARLPSDPSGAGFNAPYGMVLTLRDGRIARLEVYEDGAAALDASGLPPS
jgi:ketosteroid isomerase-like protein